MTDHPLAWLVKPLVWEAHPSVVAFRADTLIGTYKVFGVGSTPSWDFDGLDAEGICDRTSATAVTVSEAQAAAEANYRSRILAALDTEKIEALVEAAIAYKEERLKVDDTPEFCALVTAIANLGGQT